MLILDNASDVYGADENNRTQVRGFLRELAKLVRPVHGAVLLLSHVDKATARAGGTQGYSGSTAWHNSVRSRLFLSADDKTGELLLEHQKSNRGKRADSMRLLWQNGLPALIDDPMVGGVPDLAAARLRSILAMVDEFYRRGEYCSTSTSSHTNAFKVLGGDPAFPRITKNELFLILRDAERQRLIEREGYKSHHRNPCERWRVRSPNPVAFSLSSPNENAENAGGTRPPSSPVGGVGGEDTQHRTQSAETPGAKSDAENLDDLA